MAFQAGDSTSTWTGSARRRTAGGRPTGSCRCWCTGDAASPGLDGFLIQVPGAAAVPASSRLQRVPVSTSAGPSARSSSRASSRGGPIVRRQTLTGGATIGAAAHRATVRPWSRSRTKLPSGSTPTTAWMGAGAGRLTACPLPRRPAPTGRPDRDRRTRAPPDPAARPACRRDHRGAGAGVDQQPSRPPVDGPLDDRQLRPSATISSSASAPGGPPAGWRRRRRRHRHRAQPPSTPAAGSSVAVVASSGSSIHFRPAAQAQPPRGDLHCAGDQALSWGPAAQPASGRRRKPMAGAGARGVDSPQRQAQRGVAGERAGNDAAASTASPRRAG